MVIVSPFAATLPVNVTVPATGATTVSPTAPWMSIPRCCPGTSGFSSSKAKPCSTGPGTGHVQAPAAAGIARARSTATTAILVRADVRCQFCKPRPRYQAEPDVVKSDYSEPR
jgi:hypothetical protein